MEPIKDRLPTQEEGNRMNKGNKKFRAAEREAQARHNIPLADAGRDYIMRGGIDMKKYRDNFDNIFRKDGKKRGEA